MLAWTIYLSFIGVAVLMLLPRESKNAARVVALLSALGGLAIAVIGGSIQQHREFGINALQARLSDARGQA